LRLTPFTFITLTLSHHPPLPERGGIQEMARKNLFSGARTARRLLSIDCEALYSEMANIEDGVTHPNPGACLRRYPGEPYT
jgi:hypothetical protein